MTVEMKETKKKAPPPVREEIAREFVGHIGVVDFDGLLVNVAINDIRYRYGNVDVLVAPVSGQGSRWMQADKLTVQ